MQKLVSKNNNFKLIDTMKILRPAQFLMQCLMAALITISTAATADELKVGDQAPDFSLPAADGKTY